MAGTIVIGFTLYDAVSGAPLGGAAPSFLTYTDETGTPLAPPAISPIGGGGYEFTAALLDTKAIYYEIDGGASADPRYLSGVLHPSNGITSFVGFTLYDPLSGVPLSGQTPTFLVYIDENGNPITQPAISPIAGGGYKFTATLSSIHLTYYEIDGGAGADPRFLAGVYEPGVVPIPPVPPAPPTPPFPNPIGPQPGPRPQIPLPAESGRRDVSTRIVLNDGTALEIRALSGLLVDDVLVQGAKAEGYRVMTGKDVFPTTGRDIKDYLFRIGFVTE